MINAIRVKYIGHQFASFETSQGIKGICHVDVRDGTTTVILDNSYVLGTYKNQFAATDAIHDLCTEIYSAEEKSRQLRKLRRSPSLTIIGIELIPGH